MPRTRWSTFSSWSRFRCRSARTAPKTLAIRNDVAFASFRSDFVDLFARLMVRRELTRDSIVTNDMQDGYDGQAHFKQWIQRSGNKSDRVSARVDLDDLADELDVGLPKRRYASLGPWPAHETTRQMRWPAASLQRRTTDAVLADNRAPDSQVPESSVATGGEETSLDNLE